MQIAIIGRYRCRSSRYLQPPFTVTSSDGEASTMIIITVSGVASMIEVTCDPVMIPTDTGLTDCTS